MEFFIILPIGVLIGYVLFLPFRKKLITGAISKLKDSNFPKWVKEEQEEK